MTCAYFNGIGVKGHTYYYYSKWAWVDNRSRRVWQKYLGKLEDIVAAVHGGGPAPVSAEVFQWGLSQALGQEATRGELIEHIDRHCPKRRQGLDYRSGKTRIKISP